MQASGREVAEVLSRRKGQHQRAEDLRRAVERRLRLRRLSHDPAVSHDRCTPGFCHVNPKVVCRVRTCALTRNQERGRPLFNVLKMCFGACIPLYKSLAVFSGGNIEFTLDNQSSAHDLSARQRHGGALHACVKSTL